MTAIVSASLSTVDLSRSAHHQQSILPLRREKSSLFSSENADRPGNFSAEKQYERRKSSTKVRSAKSEEVFRLIDRRLQTGVHGVRHLFRSNDPNQQGKLSKEAFRRVLMQLCGFINAEEWEKVCRIFDLEDRDATITFERFLSFFSSNEKAKRELTLSQIDQKHSALLSINENLTNHSTVQRRRFLPKLTANFCFSLMKNRCRDPSFRPSDILPTENSTDGTIDQQAFRKIVENCQISQILTDETEFNKLWSKFDPENSGLVRTNVFLRLLDYRRNLADEIDEDIRRLVSRSSATNFVERRKAKSSVSPKRKEKLEQENVSVTIVPTTPIPQRETSSKFRQIVQQHRTILQKFKSNDEFLPFLDRKINEGFFCLKTVFNYLDRTQSNFITKDQLVAALNQFEIHLESSQVESFLQRHRLVLTKPENNVDYHVFLKYFQDRSESSFLARSLNNFKTKFSSSEFENVEHGIIDLLHRLFLSLSAAFKQISSEIDDLCPEEELFIILKHELALPDHFQFSRRQKLEVYHLLQCSEQNKQKRQLPYRKFLQCISKTPFPMPKDRLVVKPEDLDEQPTPPARDLSYIERTLNDLVRLRMHTFTKAFSRVDQPRTDRINKEQFYQVLRGMGTDLSRSEINLVWSTSGFHPDRSIPFSNLIRQIILFNREENQWMISQLQRSRTSNENFLQPTLRSSALSASSRALSSVDEKRSLPPPVDSHEIYERILPQVRQNYSRIKHDLLDHDFRATGLIDFTTFLEIFRRHSIEMTDVEFSSLIRADNPRNGSKVQYPFFLRKFHPDGSTMKSSPWLRIHPVYEQIIQKQHSRNPVKEIYDQRMQNPRDLKYFIRLFHSYDKSKKGFLTNDEYYSLLSNHGILLNKSSEDYYQLFSKYDRSLRDQFDYIDLLRSMIHNIMS